VQDHIVYGGFGNTSSETNASYGGRIKYTGLQVDSETGFYFAINRYYDAQTGRWISVDPLGFAAGDRNLYRYVGNSATNFTDPSGELWWFILPVVVGAVWFGTPSAAQAPAPGDAMHPPPVIDPPGLLVGAILGAGGALIYSTPQIIP